MDSCFKKNSYMYAHPCMHEVSGARMSFEVGEHPADIKINNGGAQ